MADGKVTFEIAADPRKAEQAINDVTQELKQAGAKWEDTAERSSGNMTKSFNAAFNTERIKNWAIAGIKALGDFAKSAVNAASDLEEVQNVVDTTFGSSAGEINSWAQNAIKQFGLTETQAKRFSSTMGAMLKSSGAASDDIVKMSEDLAGLAADMASFYNLDFDTAFQKIRSGISGETEPLKALGINMSVANLNAYALEKGLSKTFDKMTQGEQVMLRYQYIMNATADAQGDFARTSDGFANSQRLLASNVDSLKTKFGELLVGPLADLTTWANDTLSKLTTPASTTVLDTFSDIDLDTQRKLTEIETIAEEANTLIDVLEDIGTMSIDDAAFKASASTVEGAIGGMANAANGLKANAKSHWEGLLTTIQTKTGINFTSKAGDAREKISQLAKALSGEDLNQTRAEAFSGLITTLKDNAGALTELAGTDEEGVVSFLDNIAAAANALDPNNAEGWNTLLDALVNGLSGGIGEGGTNLYAELAEYFLAMGSGSDEARQGLLALGYTEDDITEAQTKWLATCKELVKTIPGLSDIINTQTGEVDGGIEAVRDYVKAWEEGQKKIVMLQALSRKETALEQKFGELPGLELDMVVAKRRAQKAVDAAKEIFAKNGLGFTYGLDQKVYRNFGGITDPNERRKLEEAAAAVDEYRAASRVATEEFQKQKGAYDEAREALDEYRETVEEMPDSMGLAEDANKDLTASTVEVADGVAKQAEVIRDALAAIDDYAHGVRQATENEVRGVINAFSMIETPAQKVRREIESLQEDILNETDKDARGKLEASKNLKAGQLPTIINMTEGLNSQLEYMRKYREYLAQARAQGVSEDILTMLSDGSEQSFDYLQQLAEGKGNIAELNKVYAEVQAEAQSFTDTLTDQKLSTDETFKSLVETANQAIADLDQGEAAKNSAINTMKGLIDGFTELEPDLKSTLSDIMRIIGQLTGDFSGITWNGSNHLTYSGPTSKANSRIDGSNAGGLEYVPFDGYLSMLHAGESILNEQEARVWRDFKYSGGVDYDALGGVMRDNVKAGGNVYLDGRTVGRVISEQQGNSYRSLERSGWQ